MFIWRSTSFIATKGAGGEVNVLQVCDIAPCEERPVAVTVDHDSIQCAVRVSCWAGFASRLPAYVTRLRTRLMTNHLVLHARADIAAWTETHL